MRVLFSQRDEEMYLSCNTTNQHYISVERCRLQSHRRVNKVHTVEPEVLQEFFKGTLDSS